jgi:hypothetical protein
MKFGSKVNKSKSVKRENKDFTKKTFVVMPSDVYLFGIKQAYINTTDSGANFLKVEFVNKNKDILRYSECFQSGDAKGNKTYWTDKDKVDHDLPGYAGVNELLLAALGDEMLMEDDTIGDIFDLLEDGGIETKTIPIYDFKTKGNKPTTVPVVTAIVGLKVRIAVLDDYTDIPAKDGNGNFIYENGKSKPSGKCKRVNTIDKFFSEETGLTYAEYLEGKSEGVFVEDWIKTSKDMIYDSTANSIAPIKDGKLVESSAGSDGSTKSVDDIFND